LSNTVLKRKKKLRL